MQRLILHSSEIPAKYFNEYFSKSGFVGNIILNPRDAMVFGEILDLSWNESDEVIKEELQAFHDLMDKEYGGKGITIISPELFKKTPEHRREMVQKIVSEVYRPGNGILKLITPEAAQAAYESNSAKPYVKKHLERFLSGEFRVLEKHELLERVAELSEFKNLSGLVNESKVNNGQYNEIAELDKLNNPFNRHIVIVDNNNKIIACGMWTLHANMGYGADFAIDPDYQSKDAENPSGFSRALAIKMYEDLIKANSKFRGVTFIGGVMGNLSYVNENLYGKNGFNSFPLNDDNKSKEEDKQSQYGIYLNFVGPGPILMKHMNRTAKTENGISSNDPLEYIEKAREQVKRSAFAGALAASQPLPQVPQQKVIGISSFKPVDGTKKEDVIIPVIQNTQHLRK